MARTYKRDSRGRFASGGGGSGRPAPKKAATTANNRLTRDNAGRITGIGGNGATARGGRLKTAAGNQRATQTARLKGSMAGTVGRSGKARGQMSKAMTSKPVRKLSRDQRIAANEARTDDVKRASASLRQRLPKKMRDAYKASSVGGLLLKLSGKTSGISNQQYTGISDLIGARGIKGVRASMNPNRSISISMTSLAKAQARTAEKVASRPPRRRRR